VNGDMPSTIADAGDGLREGTVTSVELTTALFARADAHDAALQTIRAALTQRYEPGVGVRLGAGAWLVSARK